MLGVAYRSRDIEKLRDIVPQCNRGNLSENIEQDVAVCVYQVVPTRLVVIRNQNVCPAILDLANLFRLEVSSGNILSVRGTYCGMTFGSWDRLGVNDRLSGFIWDKGGRGETSHSGRTRGSSHSGNSSSCTLRHDGQDEE